MTVLGFQSHAMRKYVTKNTNASIESTPTSQSLAERTYSLMGMITNVIRPAAANQARTTDLGSLNSANPHPQVI